MTEINNTPKPKKKLFQKIGVFIGSSFRGTLKSVPLIGPLSELIQNIVDLIKGREKKHSWISITVQLALVSCILYAFFTNQITISQVVEILKEISASLE